MCIYQVPLRMPFCVGSSLGFMQRRHGCSCQTIPPGALYPVGGCPPPWAMRDGFPPLTTSPLRALCRHLIDKKPAIILCVCICA